MRGAAFTGRDDAVLRTGPVSPAGFLRVWSTLHAGARPRAAAGVLASVTLAVACVPTGSAPSQDAGTSATATPTPTFTPSVNVMTEPFVDTFDRPDAGEALALPGDASATSLSIDAAVAKAAADGRARAVNEAGADVFFGTDAADAGSLQPSSRRVSNLGPDWSPARTNAWRIENGRLCAENAHNRGIWLNRTLPVNARIEFDAYALTDDGDIKAEVWGDGRSYATSISYTTATSYIVILGGWRNTIHALARLNEHGADRKEIRVDKTADDPRRQPVAKEQLYQFKIERTDGKTIRVSVNGIDYFAWADPAPLAGQGHDHFGFNDWEAKVCFDNVKVTPL